MKFVDLNKLTVVEKEDYKFLCEELKDSMDEILDTLEAFDNGTYYDMF